MILLAGDDTILPSLDDLLSVFESISKNMRTYLDAKRAQFPRLCLLSDASMHSLIAALARPEAHERLQLDLPLLFPGIVRLRCR